MPEFLQVGNSDFINLRHIQRIREEHDEETEELKIVVHLSDTEPFDDDMQHPSQVVLDRSQATKLLEWARKNSEIEVSVF